MLSTAIVKDEDVIRLYRTIEQVEAIDVDGMNASTRAAGTTNHPSSRK